MADEKPIDFDKAKLRHVFKRKAKKVLDMKKTFRAIRTENETRKGNQKRKSPKKKQ